MINAYANLEAKTVSHHNVLSKNNPYFSYLLSDYNYPTKLYISSDGELQTIVACKSFRLYLF